jgi:hypothetical protein
MAPLAVKTVDVATPDVFVVAMFVVANVPLWPETGGANVTAVFGTGFPY